METLAGINLCLAGPGLGWTAPQCRDHRYRSGRHRRTDRVGRWEDAAWPHGIAVRKPQVQDAVGRADAILNAGRVYRSTMITELWNTVAAGKETTLEQRTRCRLAAVYAADSARQAMDLMYRHGGSTSFQRDEPLGRVLAGSACRWPNRDHCAGVVSPRRPGLPGDRGGFTSALATTAERALEPGGNIYTKRPTEERDEPPWWTSKVMNVQLLF